MIQDSSILSLSEGISFQPLGTDEGAVLLHVETGQLFTCNDTTSAFLAAVDGRRTFAEVIQELTSTFEVGAAELHHDLASLADELQKEGIVKLQ